MTSSDISPADKAATRAAERAAVEAESARLWAEYKENPSPRLKRQILELHSYLPRTLAYKFARKKPHLLDLDDLIQSGTLGLIQAFDKYDPEKKVQFSTFATIRVRGAILDQINDSNWTPRTVRDKIKKVLEAIENPASGHTAEDETFDTRRLAELIEDMSESDVILALQQKNKTFISNLDKDSLSSTNFNLVNSSQDYSNLHVIMNTVLTMKEQNVLRLKFFGGYKDYEIVKRLGITQNTLNQIEKQALEKLLRNLPDEWN